MNIKVIIGVVIVIILGIFLADKFSINNDQKTNNSQSTNTTSLSTKSQCIITIDGKKYDVQTLRNSHPGGDVFICNSDMSTAFHNQHGNDANRLSPYLVK